MGKIANRQSLAILDRGLKIATLFAVLLYIGVFKTKIPNRAFRIAISNRRDASDSNRSRFRKILLSVKFIVRNSGAGDGCPNFMDTWKNAIFLQEKTHVHKSPPFRGGVFWVFFLGGECRFYFYGREDFSERF